jgi:hypothetical protein
MRIGFWTLRFADNKAPARVGDSVVHELALSSAIERDTATLLRGITPQLPHDPWGSIEVRDADGDWHVHYAHTYGLEWVRSSHV